jgi:hypothetical protein
VIDSTWKEVGTLTKWLRAAEAHVRRQPEVAMAVEELLHTTGNEGWVSVVEIEPLEKAT